MVTVIGGSNESLGMMIENPSSSPVVAAIFVSRLMDFNTTVNGFDVTLIKRLDLVAHSGKEGFLSQAVVASSLVSVRDSRLPQDAENTNTPRMAAGLKKNFGPRVKFTSSSEEPIAFNIQHLRTAIGKI